MCTTRYPIEWHYHFFLQALLGQKYGYRPVPPHIGADEFRKISGALQVDGKNVRILDQWFRLDTNMVPAIYTLQPISSILKHYNDEVRWTGCCAAFSSALTCDFRPLSIYNDLGVISKVFVKLSQKKTLWMK